MDYNREHRRAQLDTAIQEVEAVIYALRCCKQPSGCNPDCPLLDGITDLGDYQIPCCQGRMIARLYYSVDLLKSMEVEL